MFYPVEQTAAQRTAAAVRAELARRKINGTEFATALGWPRTTAWRRLNGNTAFTLDELTAVASFLEVPVADLLPREPVAATP